MFIEICYICRRKKRSVTSTAKTVLEKGVFGSSKKHEVDFKPAGRTFFESDDDASAFAPDSNFSDSTGHWQPSPEARMGS